MSNLKDKPCVTVIGGGMITETQLLPTLLHMQREGVLGEIHVCDARVDRLAELQRSPLLARAFPGQSFVPHPDPGATSPGTVAPDIFKEELARAPRGSIVVNATPDQLHYSVILEAISNDLHVCTVKPLVLKYSQAEQIARMALERGLVVGVEYHKRFDYRALMARQKYRAGLLGEFRLGQAQMIEPYYYRDSNFQNWCTCENTDMFTYVGCHYVDLVAFITGLRPVAVSVYGIRDKYPNGREGFLWTDGRVIWENGASLSVVDAIGYPSAAAGGNAQGLTMWCQGTKDATLLVHSDQYRGVKCHYEASRRQPGEKLYEEPNPDYFQMVDCGGGGLTPVGYGHRSAEYIIKACCRAAAMNSLAQRQDFIRQLDREGIMATPANSSHNELVIEAGRKSILSGGREVLIEYGAQPTVRFREYN
ncbi:Gfo/Idh/MocA family protein [Fontivita pretiosa]|uniref:Gfo/Idh/MocA family protein n=1 Tax=Fontivita pretiosa TaxID=2989684 RepID=UPI003D17B56C